MGDRAYVEIVCREEDEPLFEALGFMQEIRHALPASVVTMVDAEASGGATATAGRVRGSSSPGSFSSTRCRNGRSVQRRSTDGSRSSSRGAEGSRHNNRPDPGDQTPCNMPTMVPGGCASGAGASLWRSGPPHRHTGGGAALG